MSEYTPGQSVYIDGEYMGQFVSNLSDPLMSDEDLAKMDVVYGNYKSLNNEFVRGNYYGIRRVYSERFGSSFEQILVKTFSGEKQWINKPDTFVMNPFCMRLVK